MLNSSIGFHTMTLFIRLDKNDIRKLITHFKKYSNETGLIKMYYEDNGQQGFTFEDGKTIIYNKQDLKIIYYNEYRGIDWTIRSNDLSKDFKEYTVEVKINPKILGGIRDYITAATYDDIDAAISNFNTEVKKISPLLGNFKMYSIKRIDYCLNFDLAELTPGCTSEQIMSLIRRGNIPKHYKEPYDKVSHRTKSKPGSFYLKSQSVNINCYSKYMELQERSKKLIRVGQPPVSQEVLDSARNIIRFEVQCKYRKTYTLSSYAKQNGNYNTNKYEDLLNWLYCDDEIKYYYKKIIKMGDWYSLQEAIKIIEYHNFNKQKECRLINALHIVNQCRSLAKAKELYQGAELETFKKSLKDLAALNINPVTIPKEWGIKHIPNLLGAFYDKRNDEMNKISIEKWNQQLLEGKNKYLDLYALRNNI